MKFLLQDSKTARFMRCDSAWTADMAEALDFLSVHRALLFGMKELNEAFQILQIESDGLSAPTPVAIPLLVTAGIAHPARATCASVETRHAVPQQNRRWRPSGAELRQMPPPAGRIPPSIPA